jgi:hypothetical protein
MEVIIGSLLGGVFRLAPELLKWLDRKNERAHELSMMDKQSAMEQARADSANKLEQIKADVTITAQEIAALIEGAKAQATMTGVKWVDAINSLIRPVITFWWVIVLQTAVMISTYLLNLQSGKGYTEAIIAVWGQDEKMIVASIVSFWFLDRTIRRQQGI